MGKCLLLDGLPDHDGLLSKYLERGLRVPVVDDLGPRMSLAEHPRVP